MLIFEISDLKLVDKISERLKAQEIPNRCLELWGKKFFIASPNPVDSPELIDAIVKLDGTLVVETNAENPLSSKMLKQEFTQVNLGKNLILNQESTVFIGGPCAIESRAQIDETASRLSELGVRALRAGAFKPRTSIYTFQGMEYEGLSLLREAADKYNMLVVTEAKDTSHISAVVEYSDVIQIGTKSMYLFDLLRKAGESQKPVMLKRGFMTTIK